MLVAAAAAVTEGIFFRMLQVVKDDDKGSASIVSKVLDGGLDSTASMQMKKTNFRAAHQN